MYHRPAPAVSHVADILYVHPFGHELFNSRPIMSWLWRGLAQAGIGVLSPELPGCGDSSGWFCEARWESWKAAIRESLDWLRKASGRPVSICGLRLGAALAVEIADGFPFEQIALLQPVVKGDEALTQFLRLRVAFSGLRDLPAKRETVAGLRARLAAGEPVEVAGYLLAPELAAAIDRIDLTRWRPAPRSRVAWLDTKAASGAPQLECVQFHSVLVKPYWVHTRGDVTEYAPLAAALETIFGGSRY
jgi:exosortase A-associated hydrolase 2